ncbi:MAG: VOC family protein [Defluviitaleaceae bacterium]|nr:VOC family protein [Defluviitaleaceae bacterium]
MKVSPYIFFDGNCKDAIAYYEAIFGVKAQIMPNPEDDSKVYHAQIPIGGDFIMFCDSYDPVKTGNHMMITINFTEDEKSTITSAFNALSEGGETLMELAEVPWSKYFGLVIDKFGIKWNMCQS